MTLEKCAVPKEIVIDAKDKHKMHKLRVLAQLIKSERQAPKSKTLIGGRSPCVLLFNINDLLEMDESISHIDLDGQYDVMKKIHRTFRPASVGGVAVTRTALRNDRYHVLYPGKRGTAAVSYNQNGNGAIEIYGYYGEASPIMDALKEYARQYLSEHTKKTE